MRVGYMTNGFGPLVGEGAGVTSVKDIRYLTMGDDEEILKKITAVGFKSIEVLEGNLTKYSQDISVLKDMLQKYSAEMMSVCVGANFIYRDALEDEMFHMEEVAKAAKAVGVTYAALCGGRDPRKGSSGFRLPSAWKRPGYGCESIRGIRYRGKLSSASRIHGGSSGAGRQTVFGNIHQNLPGSGSSCGRRRRSS